MQFFPRHNLFGVSLRKWCMLGGIAEFIAFLIPSFYYLIVWNEKQEDNRILFGVILILTLTLSVCLGIGGYNRDSFFLMFWIVGTLIVQYLVNIGYILLYLLKVTKVKIWGYSYVEISFTIIQTLMGLFLLYCAAGYWYLLKNRYKERLRLAQAHYAAAGEQKRQDDENMKKFPKSANKVVEQASDTLLPTSSSQVSRTGVHYSIPKTDKTENAEILEKPDVNKSSSIHLKSKTSEIIEKADATKSATIIKPITSQIKETVLSQDLNQSSSTNDNKSSDRLMSTTSQNVEKPSSLKSSISLRPTTSQNMEKPNLRPTFSETIQRESIVRNQWPSTSRSQITEADAALPEADKPLENSESSRSEIVPPPRGRGSRKSRQKEAERYSEK